MLWISKEKCGYIHMIGFNNEYLNKNILKKYPIFLLIFHKSMAERVESPILKN